MKPKDKHNFLRLYDVHKTYKVLSEVGSGTYGRVYKAISSKNNKFVALKKIDMSRQEMDGFPITAIREIKLLRMLNHKNIIALLEIIMSRPCAGNKFRGSTYLVFEYMDHDFVGLMAIKYRFRLTEIKCIMRQMLDGLKYLHEKKIIHRDMKSANILLNNAGEVKIADFGLARQFANGPQIYYTNKVVTLWYRAPELLLGATDYSTQIDIWSLGCIFAELLTGEILFRGDKEPRQIELIYEICGCPDRNNWPEAEKLEYYSVLKPKINYERKLRELIKGKKPDIDVETLDFLDNLLTLDPKKRLTAEKALEHVFFKSEPLECPIEEMPRIEKECHETLLRAKKPNKKDEPVVSNKTNENDIKHNNLNKISPVMNHSKFSYEGEHHMRFYNNRGGFKPKNQGFYKPRTDGFSRFPGGLKDRGFNMNKSYKKFEVKVENTIQNLNNQAELAERKKEMVEKKETEDLRIALMAGGGLRSLIQGQTREEGTGRVEALRIEEVFERQNVNEGFSMKMEAILEPSKSITDSLLISQPSTEKPLDKGILNERRIKKKEQGEPIKKIHIE